MFSGDQLFFGLFLRKDGPHSVLGDVDLNVGCDFELDPVLLNSHHGAVDSPRSNDLISGFEFLDHLLMFFLSLAGGHDDQQVENHENQDERDEHRDEASTTGGGLGLLEKVE